MQYFYYRTHKIKKQIFFQKKFEKRRKNNIIKKKKVKNKVKKFIVTDYIIFICYNKIIILK